MNETIVETQKKVEELLRSDNSGHGMVHVNNVLRLSRKFAEQEGADVYETSLIALLHDVDDHKLFGSENARNLTNARRIIDEVGMTADAKERIVEALRKIGYNKRLKGIVPSSLEAKIVSDADMCDGLGTAGILRTYAYSREHGQPFFDKTIFPIEDISSEEYLDSKRKTTGVCHFFEKILKLRGLMLTESGRIEAEKRHKIVVDFLYSFFDENDAPEWSDYLERYLNEVV